MKRSRVALLLASMAERVLNIFLSLKPSTLRRSMGVYVYRSEHSLRPRVS